MIFKTLEDGCYLATDAEYGIEFRIDHLRRDRGALVGELSVSCGMLGTQAIDGDLTAGSFNFHHIRERDDWAKRLARLARTGGKIDFGRLLEELCRLVIAAERERYTDAVILRNARVRQPAPMFEILGMRYPREHSFSPFGEGDNLKSWLALKHANEQARAGVRVGWFDWELDASEQRPRQAKIDPELPDIIYVRCERPLVHDIDRLRRIRRRERLEFGWFDSAAFLTEGKPEDAVSVLATMRALRQLEMGAGVIAHSRRQDGDQQPFGSVFWHNSFRATWNIKRANTTDDGAMVTLGAFPRKFNLGPLPPAVGIEVTFDGDRVDFARTDIATIEELAESVPLWQRMRSLVRTGPMTLAAIAGELKHDNPDSLDRIVRRHKGIFTKVSGKDGIVRIALVERRAS